MVIVAKPEPTDTIIIAVVVMVGSTIIRHIQEKPKDVGKGYAQPIVYGFFLAIALLVMAVPFPAFTKALALLGMVGAFAVNGPAIYKLAVGGK
jgi:hypothetical protein